jgi:hypothetical protein
VIFPDNAFKYISSFQRHLPQLFPNQKAAAPATAAADPFAPHLQAAFELAEKGPDVIDVFAANDMIASGVPLIDVRNPDEFAKARISEARNVPLPALSCVFRRIWALVPAVIWAVIPEDLGTLSERSDEVDPDRSEATSWVRPLVEVGR